MKENWLNEKEDYPMPDHLDLDKVWDTIEEKRDKKRKNRLWIFLFPLLLGGLVSVDIFYAMLQSNESNLVAIGTSKSDQSNNQTLDVENAKEINRADYENIELALVNAEHNQAVKVSDMNATSLQQYESTDGLLSSLSDNIVRTLEIESVDINSELPMDEIYEEAIANADPIINSGNIKHIDVEEKNSIVLSEGRKVESIDEKLELLDMYLYWDTRKIRKRRPTKLELPYKKQYAIGVRFDLGTSFRNFDLANSINPANNDFYNHRKDTESVLENYAGEVFFRGDISSSWFYEVGLSVSSITMKSELEYLVRSSSTSVSDSAIVITNTDGSVSYSSGDLTQYNTDTYLSTTYNRLWTIGVPLRLGYRHNLNKYWSLDLSSGVIYNYAIAAKGSILTEGRNRLIENDLMSLGYNGSQLWQSTTKLSTSYILNYKWSVQGGLHYIHDLGSRVDQSALSDRYQSISAQFGMSYKL